MSAITIERLLVNEIREVMTIPANGTTSFSLTDSNTFYLFYNPGSTISLTNVETNTNSVSTITFISNTFSQNIPTTLNVNGVATAVKWAGGTAPSVSSAGIVSLLSFSIITVDNVIIAVLGNKSTFGG